MADDRLAAMVTEWRKIAKSFGLDLSDMSDDRPASIYRWCADELEAALSSTAPAPWP